MGESTYDPGRAQLVTAATVRSLTGFTATRDLSDGDLNAFIQRAQGFVVNRVARMQERLPLRGALDGVNVRFQLPLGLAHVIADDTLDLATTGADVVVELRDGSTDPPTWSEASVASVDARSGQVTLTAAPGSDVDLVALTGRVLRHRLDKGALETAVIMLTAHLVTLSLERPGRVNLANPAQPLDAEDFNSKWLPLYREAMKALHRMGPVVVVTDTSLRPHAWDGGVL